MEKRVYPVNLQIKVMLLFLLLGLMPLGVVSFFSIRTAEGLIMRSVTSHLEDVATDKASLLGRWILERKADLQVVAGSSVLKSMDAERMAPYLDLVRHNYAVYESLMVFSPDGRVVFSTPPGADSIEAGECLQPSESEPLILSDIELEPRRRKSVFRISVPVPGNDGNTAGIVCATVGTEAILSMILKVSLGETGECYLVNREGTFLAHKEPDRILAENIALSESFRNIFNGGNRGATYIDYRGIEVLGALKRVEGTEWTVVVEQDRDEAFRIVDRLKRYILLVIVFSVGSAFMPAWLFSYYVVNPVRRLSTAAECLARGEFEKALVRTDRSDEIGTLYNAFGDMARQLQARQHSFERAVTLREAELKETDVRLKKTQLAAARSEQLAALGRLAAGVAHEIRTPLTSLKLFLESVESEIEISPEYVEDFRVAMDQIGRMEATINRFLDYAKPRDPILSRIEVGQLVHDAMLIVKPRARQQETSVRVDVPEGLPLLLGDRRQLGEVLLNLLVNALEAAAAGGSIHIAASLHHEETGNEAQEFVRIDVRDEGPGIAAEDLPRLFDPFFTTKRTGTGLGLSIAYSAVKRHGGRMTARSVPGSGTTFSVLIPVSLTGGMEMETDGKNTYS